MQTVSTQLPRRFHPPAAPGDDDAHSGPTSEESSEAAAIKILLVEDEVFVAMDAEAILSAAGYEVVATAASADEAVAKAGRFAPDLVLMDIRLIGVRDGIDAAHDIGRLFGTPIIFVTANVDPATHMRAMQARPITIISKPFTPDSLLSAVRNFQKN
jgi:DNA-binding NarL/FixJ family response regulator